MLLQPKIKMSSNFRANAEKFSTLHFLHLVMGTKNTRVVEKSN